MLLCSDGTAVAVGSKLAGKCDIPVPTEGLHFTQIAAGANHTVLLCDDGSVLAVGSNDGGKCEIPYNEALVRYIQVAAGSTHTVLLRDDGRAIAVGSNVSGCCEIPEPEYGVQYLQVAAGGFSSLLVRSDGFATAVGINQFGQCDPPDLAEAEYPTIMFEPQNLGITFDWSNRGKVVHMLRGGQGQREGARLGWYFHSLDGDKCTEGPAEAVKKGVQGYLPLNITFLKDSMKYVCPSSPFWGESAVLDD